METETVIIKCNLPFGDRLSLSTDRNTIVGVLGYKNAEHLTDDGKAGLTEISKDFWRQWVAENKDSDLYINQRMTAVA